MFGTNPVRKQVLDAPTLWVQEVFPTIQGEGPYAGRRAVFVRLAGCNLRCWFCDTDFESGKMHVGAERLVDMIDEVVEDVDSPDPGERYAFDLCVLTGGEPLRQNVLPFVERAAALSWHIQVETAGTLWVPGIEKFIEQGDLMLVCSPKTPQVHPLIERYCDHFKYIVSAGEPVAADGLPFAVTQQSPSSARVFRQPLYRPPTARPRTVIWVQPCDEYKFADAKSAGGIIEATAAPDAEKQAKNRALCVQLALRHGYRVSLQTHKILNLR